MYQKNKNHLRSDEISLAELFGHCHDPEAFSRTSYLSCLRLEAKGI